MTAELDSAVRFPRRLLAITLALTFATFWWVVWTTYADHQNLGFQSYDSRVERLNGAVMRLDEVLTMSARMAAETGDPRWEQRYRQYEPELDAAIKETRALASDVSAIEASKQTDVANAKLVAMENRAFALVRDGRTQEARALLFSPAYEEQKALYAGGMDALVASVRTRIDTIAQQSSARATLLIAGSTVLFGLSMGAWITVIGSLRRTQRDLARQVDDRTVELRETADYLQNLIDHANAPIVVWNPAFEITRFNHAFERLTGRSSGEVLGKGLDILFPDDSREESMAHVRRTSTGEQWETVELPVQQVDGSVRTVLWNSATLLDADGRTPIATIAQGQDITRRKQAEEALRASEARHRIVVQTAMDGFWRADMQGRFLEVNEAFCRMSGYSEETLLGMSLSDLHIAETPAERADLTQQIIAKGELRFEGRQRREDGSILDFDVSVQYRPDEGGQLIAFLHDITDRKRADQALRESEHRLQLVLEGSLEGFWDHDVRTNVLVSSPHCSDLLAVSPDEMPSTIEGLVALVYPDDASIFGSAVADHFEGRTTGIDVEFRVRLHGDSGKWLQARGKVVERDADGHPVRVSGTLSDITERKRTEAVLRESEARYRALFDASADGILIADSEGRKFRYANPSLCRMFGYSVDEFRTMGVPELHPKDALQRVLADFEALVRGDKTQATDIPCLRKDGSVVYADITATEVMIDDRPCLLGLFRDITERKRAEEALARLSERNAAVLTSAGEGIMGLDSDGNHTFVSPSAAAMLGYEAEELIGTPSHAQWHHTKPDGRPYPREECSIYGTAFRDGIARRRSDEVFWRKDGTSFPVEYVSTPLLEHDKLAGAVLVFSDITERRRAEETLTQTNQTLLAEVAERQRIQVELVEARDEALEASRHKAEFLANMSHEIRTPMNGVIGMTELALDTDLTVQQREYLDMAKGSADTLLRIVNDILDFSKIEAGRLTLDPAEFRLRDTLDDTLKPLGLRAQKKGLELLCDVRDDVPDTLVADAGRLCQVVVNLVGNAIKFTRTGEVLVSVWTERQNVDMHDTVLHVSVSDTGIGIPIDKQKMIFDAFNQADGSITRTYGGTGLGLTISSNLVQMMGGRIWVESTPGRGTTFHFTVRGRVQADQAPAEAAPPALAGLPVLVVDDNATNRRILEKTLEKWQMRPTMVDSGEAALTAVREAHDRGDPFRLILLDVTMPGMDGFTVVTRLNEDKRLAPPAIVMLTSSGEAAHAARCRELGVSRYLVKPVRRMALREAVLTALGRPSSTPVIAAPAREPLHGSTLRILLVEDNVVNQRVAIGVLEGAGHAVTLAANGREALAAIDASTFDLVLMDEQMPEMSGSEATAAIRERERVHGGHLPIIALTAHALAGDRGRCLAAGADGYVAKPIARAELFSEIGIVTSHGEAPPTQMKPTAALDEATLLARVGGNQALLQEVIGLFLEDCPRLLDAIRRGLADGDAVAVYRTAHTLKGSAGNFGGEEVTAVLQRLEARAREGDLSTCGSVFAVLETTIGRLTGELTAVRKVA